MIKIYVWSDGTWCHAEDIEEYGWMSDDYETVWVNCEADHDSIDAAVAAYISSE